jgi:hypothetical protein
MCTMRLFKILILYISYIVIVFIAGSCEQDLTIEIKTNDKRLIVVGELTSDTIIHTANLYRSGSLITGQAQTVVSGAKVYITNKTDTIYYIESIDTPGLYQTPGKCFGIGGDIYNLSITNIDVNDDGQADSFSANVMMPVPIRFDSLVSKYGINGDNQPAINNLAYYKIIDNGPDYVYNFMQVNNHEMGYIENRLGTGEFSAGKNEYRVNKENRLPYNRPRYFYLEKDSVSNGDTLTFIGYNFTDNQYDFLMNFDNNTNYGDPFIDNIMDQLNVPSNLATNIEPSDKAAGYFFVYSISKISNVFK